jgi:hypothetical protein
MILSFSLDVGPLPLDILFFMFSYFNVYIKDPNCASFSGKDGAVWIYTAPTLILVILKYENI